MLAATSVAWAQSERGFELIEAVPVAATAERQNNSANSTTAPRAVLGGASGSVEAEPNNSSATANPITGTSDQITGNIFSPGAVDFFSFTATAGDRAYAAIQTQFDVSGSGDSALQLIASDGTTVIETDLNDGTCTASSSSLPAP